MKKYIGRLVLVLVLLLSIWPAVVAEATEGNSDETWIEDPRVHLNHCPYTDLLRLEGVGEPLAKKIVESRPYSSIDDLKKVNGIGDAKLNAIKAQGLVNVWTPEKVYINYASAYDLQYIEGIGAPLAQKIIDQRPYNSVDELAQKVVGIGPVKLNAIKAQGIAYVDPVHEYPAKIEEIFPDAGLAREVAKELNLDVSDKVMKEELLNVHSVTLDYRDHCSGNWEGLQHLTELRNFHFSDAGHFSSEGGGINRLKELVKLENLVIYGGELDVSLLSEMKNLDYLHLSFVDDEDLKEISEMMNLRNLRELSFMYLVVNDISPIKNMTNLTSLKVYYGMEIVFDESWDVMENLRWVEISTANVTDIRGLVKLRERHGKVSWSITENQTRYEDILK